MQPLPLLLNTARGRSSNGTRLGPSRISTPRSGSRSYRRQATDFAASPSPFCGTIKAGAKEQNTSEAKAAAVLLRRKIQATLENKLPETKATSGWSVGTDREK
eukprot:2746007-Prymnesium_polylepis.1